ncbi:hypothetical protein ACFE04_009762 [Oxalis oulophora]
MKIKESNNDTCTSEFLKHLENRGISLENQELRTIEATNGLMLKLRAQLEPFRCIADDMIPWEEKSAALGLASKMEKSKRNKLWRKRKRKRVAEMVAKELNDLTKLIEKLMIGEPWRLLRILLNASGNEHQTKSRINNIYLIINLVSVILIGILLEQEFGPLRIGLIYLLSALVGSFTSALFVRNSPVVTSSGALFGLLGAMLSWVVQNWNVYNNKLAFPLIVSTINFLLGLLPYVDNFSNIGGFIFGFLLGFVLFLTPDLEQVGEYEYEAKKSIFKLKLDRPVLRIVSLTLYCVMFSGLIVAVLMGIHINNSCSWCQYIDCVPAKRWSCNDITASCFKSYEQSKKQRIF